MALSPQDTTGITVPVTLIRAYAADHLILASQQGYSTLQDGTVVTPPDLFAAIFDDGSNSPPGTLGVVILNTLRTPLSLVEMVTIEGGQAGYPAVSNMKGLPLTTHEIPAARPHPLAGYYRLDPNAMLYGVGMWAFDGPSLGTKAAMALCYNGNLLDASKKQAVGPFVGVSWRFGGFTSNLFGVTADVSIYGSTRDFYDSTIANASASTPKDISSDVAIMGNLYGCDLLTHRQSNYSLYYQCLMVYVRYKLPGE